jgi:hypothetical protein
MLFLLLRSATLGSEVGGGQDGISTKNRVYTSYITEPSADMHVKGCMW